ncbi:MAG TPA: hypothetical protein VJH20_01370 [Candidatus Nanoarchaeia archaeon]|nr:hypothetical protein [Candidatus Nanoarchaeia archaeon]
MKIYLVHPGENDSFNLTANGVCQMQSLARRLIQDNVSVDRIYANGHEVSRQSGIILSKSLKVPVINDERFVEPNKKVIFGDLDENDNENLSYINLFIENIVSKGKDLIITMGEGIHRFVISTLTGLSLHETKHFLLFSAGLSVLHYTSNDSTGVWRMSLINDRSHLRIP